MAKTNRKRIRRGNIVEVRFLDHAQDSEDAIEFEAFGRVTDITRTSYIIHQWRYPLEDLSHKDDNEDRYAIMKSAITEIYVLERVGANSKE